MREKRENGRVVSKDPLSVRRLGETGAFGVDGIFEEGFSWRVDKNDQVRVPSLVIRRWKLTLLSLFACRHDWS